MKFLLAIILFLQGYTIYAQTYETRRRAVAIHRQHEFYLNRVNPLLLNTKNKNYLTVKLPPNTIGWYYSVSTYTGDDDKQPEKVLALTKQLGHRLANSNIYAKGGMIALDFLTQPVGNSSVEVCLTDFEGHLDFYKVQFTNFTNFIAEGTRKNLVAGIVDVKSRYNKPLYLNFRNPSKTRGVTVTVEVTAIVEEKAYVDEWSSENKNLVYEKCLTGFPTKNEAIADICSCVTETFSHTHKPQYFKSLSASRQNQALRAIRKECYQTTGNQELEKNHAKIESLLKEIQGLHIVKDYSNLADRYSQLIDLGKTTANIYNSTAWNFLLIKEYDKAKNFIVKGLGETPHNLYLQGNLANYFLLTGSYKNAEEIYLKFKNSSIRSNLSWKQAVAQDLELFEERGIYNQDFERVRQGLGIIKRETAQKIEAIKKEIIGLEITKDYPALVEKYDRLIQLGVKNANVYNSAGWFSLLNNQFEDAKAYILKGLGEAPQNPVLYGNLSSYYLLTGQYEEAKEIYLKFRKYKFDKKDTWKAMVAKDLNLFEKLDIYHKDFNRARRLLGIPKGRLAETFDPRYGAGGTMSFLIGKDSYIGVVRELDKDKGNLKIDYLNIFGESVLITRKVTNATPLTLAEYEQELAAWKFEIQKYKYTIGEYATWLQQKELQFGTITQLDNKSHKASIEYLNIYGEKRTKDIPYLEIKIIDNNEYQVKLKDWNIEIAKYKFSVGEKVSWNGRGSTTIEGEVIGLDDRSHQAEVKFIDEKGKEKIVKKGYLRLIKN